MDKIKLTKNLIKIANNIDLLGLYEEANTITKIAMDLNEDPDEDYDDFSDMFDDTFEGTISKLNPEKQFGIAEREDGEQPVTFEYNPEMTYPVYESEEEAALEVGYIVKIHPMGRSGNAEVIMIMDKADFGSMPFGLFPPFNPNRPGGMSASR